MGKKNFKKIPQHILHALETMDSDIIEVFSAQPFKIQEITKYSHLGITLSNGVPVLPNAPVLPNEKRGRYSKYNLKGRVIVRRDLPKIPKWFDYELPHWNGIDTNSGSYLKDVYQKEYIEPRFYRILVKLITVNNEQFISFSFTEFLNKNSASFEDDLLFMCNILQENVGDCNVHSSKVSEEDFIRTNMVPWEIFPPGEMSARDVFSHMSQTADSISFEEFEERYDTIMNAKPIEMIYSIGSFSGYFGAKFANDIVAFDNNRIGHALYVIYDNWENVSQTPRSELMRMNPSERTFERIVHNKFWKVKFERAIKEKP